MARGRERINVKETTQEEKKRLEATVYGRVQGVFFRRFVKDAAEALDLFGWVANNSDDTISVAAEGDFERLHELVRVLQHGPDSAEVTRVDHTISDTRNEFKNFEIKW